MANNARPLPFLGGAVNIGKEAAYAIIDNMSDELFNEMAAQASVMPNSRGVMAALSSGLVLPGFEKFFIDTFVLPPVVDIGVLETDQELTMAIAPMPVTKYRYAAEQWASHPGFAGDFLYDAVFTDHAPANVRGKLVPVVSYGCTGLDTASNGDIFSPSCCVDAELQAALPHDPGRCHGAFPGVRVERDGRPYHVLFCGGDTVVMAYDEELAEKAAREVYLAPPVPNVMYGTIDYSHGVIRRVPKSRIKCDKRRWPTLDYPRGVKEGLTTLMTRVTAEMSTGEKSMKLPYQIPDFRHLASFRTSSAEKRRRG